MRALLYSDNGIPRRNWNAARAIFLVLNEPQTDRRRELMAIVLEKSLTRANEGDRSDRALALVEFELSRKPEGVRLENLRDLHKRLLDLKAKAKK